MSTKAFFPCGGGSNLILGIGTENHIFILRTPAAVNFFHHILKKLSLWCKKKKPLPTQMHLYSSYMVPHMIPWGNYNFARSTNKIQFLMKFSHLEKNCQFNESPQI